MIQYTVETLAPKTVMYRFTHKGVNGFIVLDYNYSEGTDMINASVTMDFPLGKLTCNLMVSKQIIEDNESYAVEFMARTCARQYELRKHEKEVQAG